MNDAPSTPPNSPARQRVIEGAAALFVELGYADVSMQQIADQVGITKATLYHHFRDKEDLFVECMRYRFSSSHQKMQEILADATTFRDILTQFALQLLSLERTDMNRLMSDFKRHVDLDRQRSFWESQRRPWQYLEEGIVIGMESGELQQVDANLFARACFSALIGPLQHHQDVSDPTQDDALAIVDLLMDGMAARNLRPSRLKTA